MHLAANIKGDQNSVQQACVRVADRCSGSVQQMFVLRWLPVFCCEYMNKLRRYRVPRELETCVNQLLRTFKQAHAQDGPNPLWDETL